MPTWTGLDLEPLRRMARSAAVGVTVGVDSTILTVGETAGRSRFRIASLTKPVTAVATVLAARDAGVPLDTPVRTVLPELVGDWAADPTLTIAHVLCQTAGLIPAVTADDIAALGDDDDVCLESARLVVRAGNTRRPGERWEYYNGNYFLAGAVLCALQRTTYERAVSDLVLQPWGMTSTTFEPHDLVAGADSGTPIVDGTYPRGRRPSGGLCSTVVDLLAFARHLLDDAAVLEQVASVRTDPADPMRYGLGWAVGPSSQLYLNGRLPGYRSAFMLMPQHDLGAVVLTADSSALPAAAELLSSVQRPLTGDDVAEAIDAFAA